MTTAGTLHHTLRHLPSPMTIVCKAACDQSWCVITLPAYITETAAVKVGARCERLSAGCGGSVCGVTQLLLIC